MGRSFGSPTLLADGPSATFTVASPNFDDHVQNNLDAYVNLTDKSSDPPPPRLKGKRARFVAILLIVTLMGSILAAPALTLAQDQTSGTDSSDGIGIQVASWALTVPYCLAKTAFAVGGGIVGGLGYVFSGGNLHTAQAIWTTSITGTYIIRPAHLRGEEPVRFLGHAGENQGESVPHPIEPVPNSSASPEKK